MDAIGRFVGALLASWVLWRLSSYALRGRVASWRAIAHAISFGLPVAVMIAIHVRGGGPGLVAAIAPYAVAQLLLAVSSRRQGAEASESEGAPAA